MPRGKIYFGTKGYMQWVPAPDRNVARGGHGWSSRSDRLNGTASVRRSAGNHKEYDFTWSTQKREAIDPVLAYANGDYGDGPIYWVDPWAAETNIAPDCWASPWKGGKGGINLTGKGSPAPAITATPANNNGYPSRSATYTLLTSQTPRKLWIPVPDGHTLHLGAHGSSTGLGGVQVTPDESITTNLATNPSFETAGGTVEIRRNRVLNPYGYKVGTGLAIPDNWTMQWFGGTGASGYFQSIEDDPHAPLVLERVWESDAPTNWEVFGGPSGVPVTPGESLDVSLDMAIMAAPGGIATGSPGGLRLRVRYFGDESNPGLITTDYGSTVQWADIQIGEYTRFATTVTVPAGAASVSVSLIHAGTQPPLPKAGTRIRMTLGFVQESFADKTPFAPGLPSPDPDLTPEWTGAPNASESRLVGERVAGDFTNHGSTQALRSRAWSISGEYSLRVTRISDLDTYANIQGFINPEGGKTYTILITTRVESPVSTRSNTVFQENGGAYRGFTIVPHGTLLEGVQEWRRVVTLPSDWHHSTRFGLRAAVDYGVPIWWDNFALIEGEYDGDYFDGDYLSDSQSLYEWNGAPNASTSTWTSPNPNIDTYLTLIPVTSQTRTNYSHQGPGGVSVTLGLSSAGAGTVTLTSLTALILPTGQSPAPGGWMTGQGNMGCSFSGPPEDMGYIKNKLNSLSVISATLTEVDQ